MKFVIVSTPPGDPPDWVREAWVGLILPEENPDDPAIVRIGVLGGRPQNDGGYKVSGRTAIAALEEHNAAAAQWWFNNAAHVLLGSLTFSRDVCRVVE